MGSAAIRRTYYTRSDAACGSLPSCVPPPCGEGRDTRSDAACGSLPFCVPPPCGEGREGVGKDPGSSVGGPALRTRRVHVHPELAVLLDAERHGIAELAQE